MFVKEIEVEIDPMYDDVIIPEYKTEGSAGCDVRAYAFPEQIVIKAEARGVLIPTGLRMAVPPGKYLAVVPRSGMSVKTTMRIANQPGTVDSDYREEIKIIVDNLSNETLIINHQDRIAQFIFLDYYKAMFKRKKITDKTGRTGGFESTGRK